MGGYAWRAAFAEVGAASAVEAVVSGALTRGLEIFKCAMKTKVLAFASNH